jgi:membrane fusion protein, multidrug efflux system
VRSPLRCSALLAVLVSLTAGAPACSSGAGAGASGGSGGRGGRGGGAARVPVVLGKVEQKDVPVDVEAIGNVEAYSTISVRSQVTGILTRVFFKEGDYVKAGDHLFTIDPRPYQAALDQAQANLNRDQALLTQADAQLNRDIANAAYSKTTAARQSQLAAQGLTSRDAQEQANAAAHASDAVVDADKAAVESAKATLVAQQATVDSAKVQLGYTVIRSPITGRTGSLSVKSGNLVTANSEELTTITEVDPIYVTFSMPATHLPELKQHMADGQLSVVATPQDGEPTPVTGRLTFVDNAVDSATDTIRLKATFDNAGHALWPGEFARVSVRLTTLPQATVVPSEAVQTGQDGQFVFVVKPDSSVEQRTVTTGISVGEDVVINQGLTPGETVVTEGQLRLEPGSRVQAADPRTGAAGPTGGRGGRGGGRGRGGQPLSGQPGGGQPGGGPGGRP